jgi:hypothetical protein
VNNRTGESVDLTGDDCTFGLTAQGTGASDEDQVPAKGQIQVVNHTAGIIFHGVADLTVNDKYQSLAPDKATYWRGSGWVQIGDAPAIPVDGFQLTVTAPASASPSIFLGSSFGDFSMIMSGTPEAGNVTLHVDQRAHVQSLSHGLPIAKPASTTRRAPRAAHPLPERTAESAGGALERTP